MRLGRLRDAAAGAGRLRARVSSRLSAGFRRAAAALRRPGARLGMHGFALVVVLGAAGYTGLYVVPSGAHVPARGPAPGESSSGAPGGAPAGAPGAEAPQVTLPDSTPSASPGTGPARPQDALAGWAAGLEHLGIPRVALQAYGYAELALADSQPDCRLTWTTLAGIGRIESNHGRSHGAQLLDDGRSNPPVIGLPLDGSPGRMEIEDTDGGQIDGDPRYDRAVGPMQFIPSTWQRWAADGDGDGRADPFDIDDAALAAGRYLCAGGRDLSTGEGWRSAILSYNNLDSYVRDVFAAADEYGRLSRTGG